MMKLYGYGKSRWVKPIWLFNEIGAEFERIECKPHDPLLANLTPFGKVPVLDDDGVVILESTAILNYIADKYSDAGFIPPSGSVERARVDQWQSCAISEIEAPLWLIMKHTFIYPEAYRSTAAIEAAKYDLRRTAESIDKNWVSSDFLVGDHFTVADITMSVTLNWLHGMVGLDDYPNLLHYLNRLRNRPAFPKELL